MTGKRELLIVLLFFTIAAAVQIVHYPVGVYDMGGDLWHRSDVISAIIDKAGFKKDPFLSDMGSSTIATEIYIHAPFVKILKSHELYAAISSFLLYFIGMTVLYLLLKTLTDNSFVAAAASLIFSSSSIWFPPLGDIFALIPIYGAVSKSIIYIFFIAILMSYLRFNSFRYIDEVTVGACGFMVWINPLGFMGAGLVLSSYILMNAIFSKKIVKAIGLAAIMMAMVGPYLIIVNRITSSLPAISGAEVDLLKDFIRSRYAIAWRPLTLFNALKDAFYYTNGYGLLALAAILLPFGYKERSRIRFFITLAALTLVITCALRLAGYYILDVNSRFFMLNRNMKWIYLYIFLLVMALYKPYEDFLNSRKAKRMVQPAYIFIIAILFLFIFQIRMTFASTLGLKFFSKISSVSLNIFDKGYSSSGIDIQAINKDAEEVASYIRKKTPPDSGFVGPTWIPYKTQRALIFHENYIGHFADNRNIGEYKKAVEIKAILKTLGEGNDIGTALAGLKRFGIDYLLFEKFKPDPSTKRALYIEFENNSFLLIRTH